MQFLIPAPSHSLFQLAKAAAQSTSKAKKTIEKMLLYNIRITTHVIYGKIKETLLMMVRPLIFFEDMTWDYGP
jgi:hypothetical protein